MLLAALSLGAPLQPVGALRDVNSTSLIGDEDRQTILYAISTCEKYHATRAVAVYSTWCYDKQMCLFYSDHESDVEPRTVMIDVEGGQSLTDLRRAQMRYPRILRHASEKVLAGGDYSHTRWLVVADDDTYIFHYNMLNYLGTLDPSTPIYAGRTLPDTIYPIDGDGEGHELSVKVTTHFACGGGGSVFSREALRKLSHYLLGCIKDMSDSGEWAGWQSDWVFGACAERAGVPLLEQSPYSDRFGQFLMQNALPVLASDPGEKDYCYNNGVCEAPVSIHPVADPAAVRALNAALPGSHDSQVKEVKIQLKADGQLVVSSS